MAKRIRLYVQKGRGLWPTFQLNKRTVYKADIRATNILLQGSELTMDDRERILILRLNTLLPNPKENPSCLTLIFVHATCFQMDRFITEVKLQQCVLMPQFRKYPNNLSDSPQSSIQPSILITFQLDSGKATMFEVGKYNANNQGRPFQRNTARGNVVTGNAGGTRAHKHENVHNQSVLRIQTTSKDQVAAYEMLMRMATTTKTHVMANLTSEEAGPSYDSNTPFEKRRTRKQGVQSRSANKQVKVVNDTLTSELARYKELVGVYEQRAKFELTDRERKIDEQMRIIISDRNRKETSLKSELHSAQLQLCSTLNHHKIVREEAIILKKDFKQKEDKFLEEFLDIKRLKEKVEDRLYKQDQSVQTVHMICKPKSFYDEKNKVAIGYKNPLCLTRAKQVQPALYNGHVLVMSNHARPVVHDSEDTRDMAEITRKRMMEKMQSPLYENDRKKAETSVPKPLSALIVYPPNTPVKLVPRVLPTKSQVKINLYVLTQLFTEFEKTCKKRITPTGVTEGERGVQTALFKEVKNGEIFDQMNDEVEPELTVRQAMWLEIIEDLKAQLEGNLKVATRSSVKTKVLAPGMEIVEEARVVKPLDNALNYACQYTKLSQELLEYVIGTCPKSFNERDNKAPSTPVTRKKQVTFNDKPGTSSSNTQKHEEAVLETKRQTCSDNSLNKTQAPGLESIRGKNYFSNVGYNGDHRKESRLRKNLIRGFNGSTGKKFALGELCPSTKLSVQCCSKHMTGNRSKLKNFVKKFIGSSSVRFWDNDHFGAIMGYVDYVIGDSVISRVYYVEGLGHILFSVGQFCDSDLEVAFRKHSCFVCDINGVDLLKGSRRTNLYTISIDVYDESLLQYDVVSKAYKYKSWLWHHRLNHLNFDTINDLARKDLSFSVILTSAHPPVFPQGVAAGPTIEDTSITQADLHPLVNPVAGEPSSAQSTSGDEEGIDFAEIVCSLLHGRGTYRKFIAFACTTMNMIILPVGDFWQEGSLWAKAGTKGVIMQMGSCGATRGRNVRIREDVTSGSTRFLETRLVSGHQRSKEAWPFNNRGQNTLQCLDVVLKIL
ncbi:hypothetical protein Tco_1016106 [Tanacetum coccineum]|uniref:GAG-pre-integrase domain-containing protein n=1 Tax=Tanacetum coccineum TaxID=301880 RepID=A0ABQ5FMR3_9ASTR